jgi:hypothetical protein
MFDYFWGERALSFGDYVAHFAAWAVAWAPGLLAIGARSKNGSV